jgi:hypothetical protein
MTDWYKIKRIYVWTTKVRPTPFKPSSDTICYYKFDWNLNDSSSNGRNLSIYSWTPTYWTESWWGRYIFFPLDCWTNYWEANIPYNQTTLSFFCKGTSSSRSGKPLIEAWAQWYDVYCRASGNILFEYRVNPNVSYSAGTWWHYYTIVTDNNNKAKVYIDWQYYWWNTTGLWSWPKTIRFRFNQYWDTNTASNCNTGYLWEVILEHKEWSATYISNYFNIMRSDYWI